MKITQGQFRAATDALAQILPMTQPADAVLSQYFRLNKQLGQEDRAFVADTVFAILRRRYGLEFHTGADTPRRLLLAYFSRSEGVSQRQLEPLFGADAERIFKDGLDKNPGNDVLLNTLKRIKP